MGTWKKTARYIEENCVVPGRSLHGLGMVLRVKYQPNQRIKIHFSIAIRISTRLTDKQFVMFAKKQILLNRSIF